MPVAVAYAVAGFSLALLVAASLKAEQALASVRARQGQVRQGPTRIPKVPATAMGGLRFRLLLLDHDDTTVKGTEEVHYPAHVESLRILRPDLVPVSLEEWFRRNHDPGVSAYLKLLFTSEQMVQEHEIWEKAMEQKIPAFYEGMAELLKEYRARGGRVAVVSHSPAHVIQRHYEAHPWAEQIRPDLVLGWDKDPAKRKPSPWPALHALQYFGVQPAEVLALDDLSPGVKMAKAAGVTAVAAGWGHTVQPIQDYMRRECAQYFETVQDFADYLLTSRASAL
ncbi:unnamed protein product [Symbiodinium sp. KB8]|nr:unnamed protein product [Symbiodinium sp. KB8]